ncbi:MAG TPA: pyridoxamine 5'-phosphate oxidase [Burkholderiaceae bacterium]|jgi:pyridoxamine 5'-phosphate oxidase|nr:pyridoxamine 5'-phosphate oxidase [Burkholderiaceae bacterium]
MSISNQRTEYGRARLSEQTAAQDPIEQFGRWFDEAVAAAVREVNAMSLATATRDGRPCVRIVLMKDFDASGFVFYTNYDSRKGRELQDNPRACALFFWSELERQVRIEGTVSRIPAEESDRYFAQRPLDAQLGAWASPQSQPIADRAELEARLDGVRARFSLETAPPRPPQWGGLRIAPAQIEFWQGGAARLHDRLLYVRDGGGWRRSRLAP